MSHGADSFASIKIGLDTSDYAVQPRPLSVHTLRFAQIPEAHWRAKLDRIPESARGVVQGLHNYIPKEATGQQSLQGVGIIFYGSVGVGKSAAASLLALQYRRYRKSVFYTAYRTLRDAKRSPESYYFDAAQQITILDRAYTVDVLVVDDITTDDLQDRYFGSEMLMSLLRLRAQAKLVTLVTTRLAPDPQQEGLFPMSAMASIPGYVGVSLVGPNQTLAHNNRLAARIARLDIK